MRRFQKRMPGDAQTVETMIVAKYENDV